MSILKNVEKFNTERISRGASTKIKVRLDSNSLEDIMARMIEEDGIGDHHAFTKDSKD